MNAIVQINFPISEGPEEYSRLAAEAAPMFTGLDGLLWKIWLLDEATGNAGGIYLFNTRQQAQAYADSDIVAHLKQARPGISVRVFDTLDEPGLLTRSPAQG